MHYYLDCNELNAGVLSVIKALPLRSTMPILDGIYMEATNNGVRLMCSDLMMQKECFLPSTVDQEGRCVVPAKMFAEVLRKMPESIIEISLQANVLVMQSGKTRNQVQCIDFDEFPTMKFSGDSIDVKLDKNACKNMINQTAFAVAQDDSKPMLTGVYMEMADNKITMVATDSYQFAMNTMYVDNNLSQKSTIIPGKTIQEIARMMDEAQETVILSFSNTHVKVDLGGTALVARLLDGNYIDYKRIIPKESKTRVLINRKELFNSIERAQLVAREGNNNILMRFEDNMLYISAESFIGKLNDELEVQLVGDNITISFNPKYCLNILKNIADDTVYFEFNNNINPCVVRPVQGESYYFLIVPMRIY